MESAGFRLIRNFFGEGEEVSDRKGGKFKTNRDFSNNKSFLTKNMLIFINFL